MRCPRAGVAALTSSAETTQDSLAWNRVAVVPASFCLAAASKFIAAKLQEATKMRLAKFMSSGTGRGVRIVAGVVLIGVGIYAAGALGIVLAVIGAVFLLVGATNVCLLAPVVGGPLMGRAAK